MPAVVQPEKLLKELAVLWKDLGKQESQGVLRACSLTLISILESQDQTDGLGEMLATLMHEHPARLIMVQVERDRKEGVDARVTAQCWMPFGKRQQICCERIELNSSYEDLDDVPPVILGLTVPDLPVVLFCPSPALLKVDGFGEFLALSNRLILDSGTQDDSGELLDFLASMPARGPRGADLTWSRLTPWREVVAKMFDEVRCRKKVYGVEEIQILYAGASEPAGAYYLAGWFMHVLGTGVNVKIARGVGPDYASIAKLTMRGKDVDFSAELMEPLSVQVTINGNSQRVVFPDRSGAAAMREELGIIGRDAVFEQVLGLANLLRGSQKKS